MIVGCVKEIKEQEFRVGLTPGCVLEYVKNGHKVLISKSAGEGSGFYDQDYATAGAELVDSAKEVFQRSDMIVKVKEPLEEEYGLFKKGQILYTYLHLAADRELTDAMLEKQIKGVAYETMQTTSGALPCLKPMSEIAGRLSIQEGTKYLEKTFEGRGVLLGGVPGVEKGKVVILGAGTVGINACKLAVGIGANVTIIDLNLSRLEYIDDLFGGRVNTLYSSEQNIINAIKEADLLVGAVLIPGAVAPKLIRREHLKYLKKGSVMVDVAVDQGGCFETTKATTHADPTFVIDGVVHYCVANMPGAVPRTSTLALTNATQSYGIQIANKGLEKACRENRTILTGLNVYMGNCTFNGVAEAFGLKYVAPEEVLA